MDAADILFPLLFRIPLFIVWFVGIVIAILRWREHPRASILITIGIIILAVSTFLATILPGMIGRLMRDIAENRALVGILLLHPRILSFVDLLGWILVLIAVFSNRRAPAARSK